jgi:hypothetical protein
MDYLPLNLPINKGLLDARSTGRTLSDLRQKFFPVEFFDLCSIIEEIVLRDEIVLIGKFDLLPREYREALQPFIDDGVFKLMLSSTKIIRTTATDVHLRDIAANTKTNGLTNTSLCDADYAVTRLLGAEIELNIPTISLLQHLHNFQFTRRPILDNTACDLVARYEDLKQRAEAAKAIDFNRLALRQVSIPPIALMVMQRAQTFDQVPREILEVRHQFRSVRSAMHDLAETLADRNLSSSDLYRLITIWEERWKKLFDAVPSCTLNLGQTVEPLLKNGAELAKAYSTGSIHGALMAGVKIIQGLTGLRGAIALRPVHLSVNNYLRTRPDEMISAASNLFEESSIDVRRKMEAIGATNSTVWMHALAPYRPQS